MTVTYLLRSGVLLVLTVSYLLVKARAGVSAKIFETERDIYVARLRRDRDFEQKFETRPRLERSETETGHETFETKRLQYFANIFDTKFWTFGELPNTLQ